jgi:hypothetical protein
MEAGGKGGPDADEIASKPNRAAIVLAIGDGGELSFKDLKAKMNLGVGTLYYHLDGLKGVVTQNSSKQYILTDEGKLVYQKVKGIEGAGRPTPRQKLPSAKELLGEIFLFDSHAERLAVDSMSNISITLGILLTGAALAAVDRVYDAMFILVGRFAQPGLAFATLPISWLFLYGLSILLVSLVWKARFSFSGLAGGSALALIPMVFSLFLEAMRRTFHPSLDFLGSLYALPFYPIFQAVLVVWAAYIFVVSLRSATELNLEKALVVALVLVIINLAYVWGRPLLLPVH